MADDQVPWPDPPRQLGPWAGGPPVAPPGNTALPPLPGAGGVVHNGGSSNPWTTAGTSAPIGSSPPPRSDPYPTGAPARGPLVDRAPGWVLALSALIVLALVAGGAYVVLKGKRTFPSAWDPRIRPIADWVAKERKLSFDHPVEVKFLEPAEYTKVSTGGSVDEAPDATSKAEAANQVAQLRALGFISGELDLDAATKTLADSGTLAFYNPEDKVVYVRGTAMTPSLRVTLAHELTHVLQDQHFDLTRVASLPDSEGGVLRALAEGDASRIEDAYAEKVLSADERRDYEKQSRADSRDAIDKLDDKVPPILTAVFASPYVLGPELLTYLTLQGGDRAIDKTFTNIPSEEVLFDPQTYKTPAAAPVTVELEAPTGTKAVDDGEFGPTTWFLLLASRLEPTRALAAVDGWGGDHYVVYRDAGKVCVGADVRADSPKDLEQFSDALGDWSAKSPKGTSSVDVDGSTVHFRSCDPGKDAKAVGNVDEQFLALPVSRTQVYDEVVKSGGSNKSAACFSSRIVERFTLDQLTDDSYISGSEGQQAIDAIRSECI